MGVRTYKCNRCGEEVVLKRKRNEKGELVYIMPKSCGKCHSPYYNKPRKRNMAEA